MVQNEFFYFVVSGFLLMVLPVIVIGSFFLRGFFWPWMKVRASQGRLVLIKVNGRLRSYFRPGSIVNGTLRYFVEKQGRSLIVPKEQDFVYRAFGVYCVDVDEEKNAIYTLSAEGVSGFDAESFDDQIVKALKKPSIEGNKQIVIIILLLVIIVIGLIAAGLSYKSYQTIQQLAQITVQSTMGGF